MISQDAQYLRCISCGSDLKATPFRKEDDDIVEGRLSCVKCRSSWPIISGAPRLLPKELMESIVLPRHPEFFKKHDFGIKPREACTLKERTAQSFGFEWLNYPKILAQFEKDWQRYFNPFITKEDIGGKVVADFGCGMAKHGHFICKYGAKKYIGVDLSDAVEAARKNTARFDSLIIQADIYNLPLKGERIDLFYSIGVLHHLPDPEQGFRSITGLMRKGSRIFIWVYGKHKNKRAMLLYNPIRVVTTRMPRHLLYRLCHVPALAVHGINLGYKGLKSLGMHRAAELMPFKYYAAYPYAFKVSDSFDVLGTPKQVYYTMEEIGGWFKRAKLKGQLAYDEVQGIKGFAVR